MSRRRTFAELHYLMAPGRITQRIRSSVQVNLSSIPALNLAGSIYIGVIIEYIVHEKCRGENGYPRKRLTQMIFFHDLMSIILSFSLCRPLSSDRCQCPQALLSAAPGPLPDPVFQLSTLSLPLFLPSPSLFPVYGGRFASSPVQ